MNAKTTRIAANLLSVLLLVTAGFLFGCGDGDDGGGGDNNPAGVVVDGEGPIEGTWDLTGMRIISGALSLDLPRDSIDAHPRIFVFEEDSTGTLAQEGDTLDIEWSVDGTTLSIEGDEVLPTDFTFAVGATKMTLTYEVEEQGLLFTVIETFTRREEG
jgi:hypothetical protein